MKAKNIKTIIGGGLVALGLATVPAGVQAWGPERPTFTNAKPATYITFNSITDNAAGGNETNFVRVREKNVGSFVDTVVVEPGKTYEVQIYYHNNAGSSYNLTATDTKISAYYPGVVAKDLPGKVGAMVSSKDANPVSVWDEANFTTESTVGVKLVYKSGTARLRNTKLDGTERFFDIDADGLFSNTGALIGYDALDGKVPGCAEYSGTVTFELEAAQAEAYLSKLVSTDGENYYDNVNAKVGDTVYYRVIGKNKSAGSDRFTDVRVKDPLAVGLAAQGKALFTNASQSNVALDDFFQPAGQNVGTMSPTGNGWEINYSAKITPAAIGGDCGSARIINTVYMDYLINGGPTGNSVANSATVTVSVPCPENPKEMPKTGGDFGELIMTMLIAIAGVGLISYIFFGARLVKRQQVVNFDEQTNMKGMGI